MSQARPKRSDLREQNVLGLVTECLRDTGSLDGRPCGDRTHDTLLKRQALYH